MRIAELRVRLVCGGLLLLVSFSGAAQDFAATNILVSISKAYYYDQTNSGPPEISVNPNLLPLIFVSTAAADEIFVSLKSAQLATPAPDFIDLIPTNYLGLTNVFHTAYEDYELSNFEAKYPAGLYQATVGYTFFGGAVQTARVSVALSGDLYPNTPTFLNVENLASIPANQDLVLTWQPFQGATTLDQVGLSIFEGATSQEPLFQGTYPATNSLPKAVIPAGTLKANKSYDAILSFQRHAATAVTNVTFHIAPGIVYVMSIEADSSYTKQTGISLQTVASAPLELLSRPGTSPFRFRFASTINQRYVVQVSGDLRLWENWLSTNAVTTNVLVEQPWSTTNAPHFFRVLTSP